MSDLYANPGGTFSTTASGAASGLVGIIGYRVEALDGTLLIARTVGGIVEAPAGSGVYIAQNVAVPVNAAHGEYLVLWDDGAGQFSDPDRLIINASGSPAVPLGPGYPVLADLIGRISGDARDYLDTLDADQQQALYEVAIFDVESFTQQSFAGAVTEERAVPGRGSDELLLPARLADPTRVQLRDTVLDASEYTLSEDGAVLVLTGGAGSNYYERTMRDLMGPAPRVWSGAVLVTGTWGWDAPPQAVVTALRLTLEDIALAEGNELASTIRSYQRLGISAIRQGPLNVDLVAQPPVSDRVARHLQPYVWEFGLGTLV